MQYKYHPIVAGLKVNEDGTSIIYNGRELKQTPINDGSSYIMRLKGSNISRLKLVCECWNGPADNPEYIAAKIDIQKGSHYTNLEWRKRGQGKSHNRAETFRKKYRFNSLKEVEEFMNAKPEEMSIAKYCETNKISETALRNALKRYGKEN